MKTAKYAVLLALALAFPRCASAVEERAPELAPITAADAAATAVLPDVKMPVAAIDELRPAGGNGPVIITVAGIRFDQLGWGPLEPRTLKQFLHWLFHKKTFDDAAVEKAAAEYNRQFDILNEGGEFTPPAEKRAPMPDTCMEDELSKLPEFAPDKVTFVPFIWSRDPDETDKVVPVYMAKLAEVYDTYKGRPIYILAHSWGTVLTHETLHRLEKSRPDVRVDKFVSIGSPLVPSSPFSKLLLELETITEGLQREITKPANLGYWKNIWSSRDPFSNAIKAADSNVQVDADVPKYEGKLKELILHNGDLRMLAKNDFFKMINFKSWHSSYVYDFHADLESLKKEVNVSVLDPVVAPQLETK